MKPSVTKSKLFVLALLLAFLSSTVPSLATQKSAFMRVYDLKAGHSNRGEVNGNPINFTDPSGLNPGQVIGGFLEVTAGAVLTPEPSPTGEVLVIDGARRIRAGLFGMGVTFLGAPRANDSVFGVYSK